MFVCVIFFIQSTLETVL